MKRRLIEKNSSCFDVELTDVTEEDKSFIESCLLAFESSRSGSDSINMGKSLREDLPGKNGQWMARGQHLEFLSKWCHTGGSYIESVEPARKVATLLLGTSLLRLLDGNDVRLGDYTEKVGRMLQQACSTPLIESENDLASSLGNDPAEFDPDKFGDTRERALQDTVMRRGQSRFRNTLVYAYEGRCAVTGFDFEAALEAAHIAPFLGENHNKASNGLLLRADIHRLFDLGLIAIDTPSMSVLIAESLRSTAYKELEGKRIRMPQIIGERPSRKALDKHRVTSKVVGPDSIGKL